MFQKFRMKLSRISDDVAFFAENTCHAIKNINNVPNLSHKLRQFRSDCFDIRIMHRLLNGYRNQQITSYDDQFIQKLEQYNIIGESVWSIISDFKPKDDDKFGHCFERSYLMFLCNHDAVWVYGKNQNLAIKYGKQNSTHAWVEIGDFVYDPTSVQRYPRKMYYEMLKISHVKKMTHEKYHEEGVNANLIMMVKDYIKMLEPYIEKQKNNIKILFDY